MDQNNTNENTVGKNTYEHTDAASNQPSGTSLKCSAEYSNNEKPPQKPTPLFVNPLGCSFGVILAAFVASGTYELFAVSYNEGASLFVFLSTVFSLPFIWLSRRIIRFKRSAGYSSNEKPPQKPTPIFVYVFSCILGVILASLVPSGIYEPSNTPSDHEVDTFILLLVDLSIVFYLFFMWLSWRIIDYGFFKTMGDILNMILVPLKSILPAKKDRFVTEYGFSWFILKINIVLVCVVVIIASLLCIGIPGITCLGILIGAIILERNS